MSKKARLTKNELFTLLIAIGVFIMLIAACIVAVYVHNNPEHFSKENNKMIVLKQRVDYLENPIGIDDPAPCFSWYLSSDEFCKVQTAYKLVVSADKTFKDDSKEVWNSGKVTTYDTNNIVYKGSSLKSATRYYWKVLVWDENDEYSESQNEAYFETGLMDDSEWKDARWIKYSNGTEGNGKPNFTLEFDMTIKTDAVGVVFGATDKANFLMWQFNVHNFPGKFYLRPHEWTNGNASVLKEIDISSYFGKDDVLKKEVHVKIEAKDSKIYTYINSTLVNTYSKKLSSVGTVGFRVSSSSDTKENGYLDNMVFRSYDGDAENVLFECNFNDGINPFSTGTIEDSKLYVGTASGEQLAVLTGESDGIPLFRKSFICKTGIKSAKLYTTALGVFDAYCNGSRVGRLLENGDTHYDEMKPGWTDYNKRVLYFTYDITHLMKAGEENVLGAMVAPGWWTGRIAHSTYGSNPEAFIAKLVLTYKDGSTEVINTDESWSTSKCGPVVSADIWDGETYNGAVSETNWCIAGYNTEDWNAAGLSDDFKGCISAYMSAPVCIREELTRQPVYINLYEGANGSKVNTLTEYDEPHVVTLKKGQTVVYDMGQNMVGYPEIVVQGDAYTRVKIRFGEMLNDSGKSSRGNDGPEGSIYTANYRSAVSTNVYILSGEGRETYHTRYSFYGFRYVEVTADADIEIVSLTGLVLGSETYETGFVETSNESINKLLSNVLWGQRGNYLSVPTDCPQRDERLGWTGDTQLFSGAAAYNADVDTFFRKWLQDARDSQSGNGAYTDVIPASSLVGTGNAGWGDAGIIVPYTMYIRYNDKALIADCYESMEKYMKFLEGSNLNGAGVAYGDWLSYEPTDSRLIAIAYYAYDCMLMKKMSEALGKTDRADYYRKQYDKVKDHFDKLYLYDDGTMKVTSQTSYILALKFDLLPNDASKETTAKELVKSIQSNGNNLSTGFIGTGYIVQTLSETGNDDMAYTLLLQRDDPSWLYSVDQGATTIWERWNSYTVKRGFGDVGMNSFNHYAYGAVAEWMYQYMCGIETGDNGFRCFNLKPTPDTRQDADIPEDQERVTFARSSYESVYGTIKSEWTTENCVFDYKCSIPCNTSASLELPVISELNDTVKINGEMFDLSQLSGNTELTKGVTFIKSSGTVVSFKLRSGNYTFEVIG